MADRIRAHDWAGTPLGAIEDWPCELVLAVNMMLASKVVTAVIWGAELLLFYNDAYTPHLAEKHPALGKEWMTVWGEVAEDVGTLFVRAYETGEAVDITSMPMQLLLHGELVDKQYGVTIVPVWGESQHEAEIVGLYQTATDYTEGMLAKRERDAVLVRLNSVMEDTNDSIMTIDRNWVVTYMNRSAAKVTAPINPVGRNLWECYPAFQCEGSPWLENYHRAMDERSACSFEAFYPEPIHVWVQVQVVPSREGITLFFTDVTERKLQENWQRRMYEDRQRFFMLVEATCNFVAMWDMRGKPFYVNPAGHRLMGLESVAEFRGTIRTLFFCEDQGRVFEEFMPAVERKGHGEMEVRFRHFRTGEAIWMNYQSFVLRDSEGRPSGFATVSTDLTAQKAAAASLMQTEKLAAVGLVASTIAHEINNPVECVTNLIYLTRHSEGLSEEAKGYLDTVDHELRRISAITNQTLSLHRQLDGATPCPTDTLIESALSIQQSRIESAHVQVVKQLRTSKPVLCLDGEIRQVLNNLIGNAVDAMGPGGGRLVIRSRETRDWGSGREGLSVTVADNARGISAKELEKIFEPFFTTKGHAGTGLGLWVSKEIMTRHKGSLRARSSQRAGRSGTAFTLFLPFEGAERQGLASEMVAAEQR